MRAAVIGCGRMGAEPSSHRLEGRVPAGWLPMSHAEALRAVDGITLVALCDSNEELLRQRGNYYGIEVLYTDHRELIEKVMPEIITIATRTPQKGEILRSACTRGVRGLYIEKPIANSLAECRASLSNVQSNQVRLAYGVNRRYHAVYRHAKEILLNGEIGEVLDITVEHGTEQLLWSHPHSVDLILFFANSTGIERIQASLRSDTVVCQSSLIVDSDPIVEHAFFQFASGLTAHITRTGGLNVVVGGTRGNLVVHADGSFIQVNKPNKHQTAYYLTQQVIHDTPQRSATVVALTELVESVSLNTPPPIALEEILAGTQMLLGCLWSYMQGSLPVNATSIPHQLVVTGKYGGVFA